MDKVDHTPRPWEADSDDLERLALEECVKRQRVDHRVSVLVLPVEDCTLGARFAQLGAQVVLAAAPDLQRDIEGRILAAGLREQVSFAPYALPALPDVPDSEPYDIIYLRQGLCHLPYAQAKEAVRALMKKLRIGGKLYLSIIGRHSELAVDYPGAETPLQQRFAELSPVMVKRYGITGKVCLYSERELFMLLLESGASVLRTFTTTYGTVRGIAVRV